MTFMTNQNVTMFLCIIVGLVLLSWFVLPSTIEIPINNGATQVELEGYEPTAEEEGSFAVPNGAAPLQVGNAMALKEDQPMVDARTGSLIDGPGYERAESETPYSDVWSGINSNHYFLDVGDPEMNIANNLCSKS